MTQFLDDAFRAFCLQFFFLKKKEKAPNAPNTLKNRALFWSPPVTFLYSCCLVFCFSIFQSLSLTLLRPCLVLNRVFLPLFLCVPHFPLLSLQLLLCYFFNWDNGLEKKDASITWSHYESVQPHMLLVKCKYYLYTCWGSVARMKHHLVSDNVSACTLYLMKLGRYF